MTGIGTLRETALHAALKQWYARPGDELEAGVGPYVVDILRGDTVIEIQTHNFTAIRGKLNRLVPIGPVCLVHPVALERWIVRVAADGQKVLGRRKSPWRGCLAHLFLELVSFPELMIHPNFTLEVLLIREEEVRCPWPRPKRGWRRAWRVFDRRLVEVAERLCFTSPADCLALLPAGLAQPFTNRELAEALNQTPYLAAKMTYCLRHMGALQIVGSRGRARAFAVA